MTEYKRNNGLAYYWDQAESTVKYFKPINNSNASMNELLQRLATVEDLENSLDMFIDKINTVIRHQNMSVETMDPLSVEQLDEIINGGDGLNG